MLKYVIRKCARKCAHLLLLVQLIVVPTIAIPAAARQVDDIQNAKFQALQHFGAIFEYVMAMHLDENMDPRELIQGALAGMMAYTDPFSGYMERKQAKHFEESLEGTWYGVGLYIHQEGQEIQIVQTVPNSPASQAGIQAGDIIMYIGNELMTSQQQAIDALQAHERGERIRIVIKRSDLEMEFFLSNTQMQRGVTLGWTRNGIGYIRLMEFVHDVDKQLIDMISALGDTKAMVIDLRGNGGGLFDQAVRVSDLFIKKGEIVAVQGRGGTIRDRRYAKQGDMLSGQPMLLLVDEKTASASEIFAGAMKDSKRAIIAGRKTFGKGSIQNIIELSGEEDQGYFQGDTLRITVARYLTPSGTVIHKKGILPDVNLTNETADMTYEGDVDILHGNAGAKIKKNDIKVDGWIVDAIHILEGIIAAPWSMKDISKTPQRYIGNKKNSPMHAAVPNSIRLL